MQTQSPAGQRMQASPAGQWIDAFQPRHTKPAELMLRAEDDVLAYKTFPKAHWRQILSTIPWKD